jgi:hypothetical protein
VCHPLDDALIKPAENPYQGRKRETKLSPAAPTTAQSSFENRFASNLAI